MSSPLSNLKKEKKLPLSTLRSRDMPFAKQQVAEEEVLSRFLQEDKKICPRRSKDISNDSLVSSMTKRLSIAEGKLVEAEELLRKKDKRISILEEKLLIYKRTEDYSDTQILELQKKCHRLQKQVHEMEMFLEDYGMIWVGAGNEGDISEDESEESGKEVDESHTTWNQDDSIPRSSDDKLDFDLIYKNIEELNAIAGEGEHFVKQTKDGARLQVKESVPITFYANGIFMFGGPFRPYNDPMTQHCIKDLLDGYFPSELQSLYPEGVPFKVTDKRYENYDNSRLDKILFPGTGQYLSPEKSSLNTSTKEIVDSVTSSPIKTHSNIRTLNDNNNSQQSVDSLISKLPSSVIRKGQVIDIRGEILETLRPAPPKSDIIVVETDIVKELKSRLNIPKKNRPPTPGKYTTLRIKSETGLETFLLKMKYSETIRDLRCYLDNARGTDANQDYEIKSAFPNETYTELSRTLREYGLIPNATLYLYISRK